MWLLTVVVGPWTSYRTPSPAHLLASKSKNVLLELVVCTGQPRWTEGSWPSWKIVWGLRKCTLWCYLGTTSTDFCVRIWDRLQTRYKVQLESEFDRLKKTFIPAEVDEEDEDDEDEDNLIFFNLPSVPDDPKKSVYDGQIRLTHKEMVDIFMPTFQQIKDLIMGQVEAAQKRTNRAVTVSWPIIQRRWILTIQGVLLVGGFGESRYLRDYLLQNLGLSLGNKLEILQPADAWV